MQNTIQNDRCVLNKKKKFEFILFFMVSNFYSIWFFAFWIISNCSSNLKSTKIFENILNNSVKNTKYILQKVKNPNAKSQKLFIFSNLF